jgi:hypothetical protein
VLALPFGSPIERERDDGRLAPRLGPVQVTIGAGQRGVKVLGSGEYVRLVFIALLLCLFLVRERRVKNPATDLAGASFPLEAVNRPEILINKVAQGYF